MTDYCSALSIAAHLQRDLTDEERQRVPAVAAAVTRWLDRRTGSRFGEATITAEQHTLDGPFIYLRHRPVVSITTVQLRVPYVGSPPTTLVAGHGYELLDPTQGQVSFLGVHDAVITDVLLGTDRAMGWLGWLVLVDYTSGEAVPPDLALAADILAVRWLVDPEAWDQAHVAVGGGSGVSVTRRADAGVPPEVLALVPKTFVFA